MTIIINEGKSNFQHIDQWVESACLNDSYLVRHYHYNDFNQLEFAFAFAVQV